MSSLVRRRWLLACSALATAAFAPAIAQAQLTQGGTGIQTNGQAPTVVQTGRTTDISLHGSRTIIGWSSFNLPSDQTVVYRFNDRGWIVLNKVSGQAVIDGQLEGLVGSQRGGNVWFSAPGGVVFGPNARVNVGGLLATTGQIAPDAFLDGSNFNFGFTGAGPGRVEVRPGAQLSGNGGTLALIAGSVATQSGATVQGTGTVAYAAANDFTVRFAAAQAGDLDLVDFVVPAGGGTGSTTPLTLAGQTVGGNVVLAVVNRTDVASAVISAPGVIGAQSATASGGDVILSTGVDLVNRLPTTRTNAVTETAATFGAVSAQRDVIAGFGSPTTVRATQLGAGRDLGFAGASLDVDLLTAGRFMAVDASRGITVRNAAQAGSTAVFRTTGALNATGGSINAAGRLTIDAGTLQAGQLNSNRSVVVNASGAGTNGVAVTVGSALAEDDILITSTNASGGIQLGSAFITGARADEAPAGRTLQLVARGANADVTFGGPAGSALTGASAVTLIGGRDVTADVAGLLPLAGGSAGRNFTVRARDLDITGPVTATNFRVESLVGGMTLGGTAAGAPASGALGADAAGGLLVTDAEFQQITVTGEAAFYAGSPNGTARGDLTVRDLSINPARIPRLLIAAGADNDVSVTGVVTPVTNGGAVVVGEDALDSPFRPGRILITGSIGVAGGNPDTGFTDIRAFDLIDLNARRDVLMGSPRFVGVVAAVSPNQIDIAAGQPTGVAAATGEQGKLFLAAAQISISAPQKVVQQNTGTTTKPNGILIAANSISANRPLTLSPAQVVDLWGSYRDGSGILRNGLGAVAQTVNLDGQPIGGGGVRFNGCELGAGGCVSVVTAQATAAKTISAEAITAMTPDSPSETAEAEEEAEASAEAGGDSGPGAQPPLISFAPPAPDEVTQDPVTIGTGSDELWRTRKAKKAPN